MQERVRRVLKKLSKAHTHFLGSKLEKKFKKRPNN